jgi:hypothetical protein
VYLVEESVFSIVGQTFLCVSEATHFWRSSSLDLDIDIPGLARGGGTKDRPQVVQHLVFLCGVNPQVHVKLNLSTIAGSGF